MSEDVCKANSTGQIGQLSNQQLSESLIYERIRSEQHRLNYERLRALYDKLQHDLNSSTLAPPNSQSDRQVPENSNANEDEENAIETGGAELPTELIKSPKRCSIFMDNFPGLAAGPSSYSNPNKNIDVNVLLKKPLSPSGNSTTNLQVEDGFFLPGNNVNSPHNEILRQCSRWKELYLNLLDEFQNYKCGTDVIIMNNEELLAEKVREASRELELARAEQDTKLEKLRQKLDTMLRDRTVLQAEIKALREELKEANSKIRDKTVLCETLQRTIDEQTMNASGGGGSHERRCDIPSHSELGNKLSAAEGRVLFLQEEIQEISNKNIRLQDKIFSLIRESTQEITTLRKALSLEEDEVKKERLEFQYQHDEALQYVQTQQAYIEDLDKFVNERVERNNEVSKKVQDFASQVAQETEHTLQMLEDRLKKTTEEKTKLEEALFKASKVIRELTEEARRQRVTASRFITHIYQILSIPPGDSKEVSELRTSPYVVLCDNIVNSIDEDSSMAHTFAIDTKIHMKELLKRITFWSHQFELQKKSLRDRVTQLENLQIEQKKMAQDEIERYRKKCEFYREILRQLRVRVGIEVMDDILKNVLPPHIYEQTEKWLSKYKPTTMTMTTATKKKTIEPMTKNNDGEEETESSKITGDGVEEEEEQDDENVGKLEEEEQDVEIPIKIPARPLGEFQAQQKFGSHLTTSHTPFISSNLHNYLKKHERFVHILDNVEKYLKSKPEELNDDNLENELPPL